jgi:transposase
LYGYSVGIFSSRKLARGCEENLALQYLAGMEKPVYRVLSAGVRDVAVGFFV